MLPSRLKQVQVVNAVHGTSDVSDVVQRTTGRNTFISVVTVQYNTVGYSSIHHVYVKICDKID